MDVVMNVPIATALQFDGENVGECLAFAEQWLSGFPGEQATYNPDSQVITTARGYPVNVTDWLIGPAWWGTVQTATTAEIVSNALFEAKYTPA